jgi:hypothetical protein
LPFAFNSAAVAAAALWEKGPALASVRLSAKSIRRMFFIFPMPFKVRVSANVADGAGFSYRHIY